MNKGNFQSFSAERLFYENYPNWVIYKVVLMNPNNQYYNVKVCLPLDESLVSLCSDNDEPCAVKALAAENAKKSNEDYLLNIKTNYFSNRPIEEQK